MKDATANASLKEQAALRAASLVRSQEVVGLGTGSTAAFAIAELGRRKREEGLSIRCVATSLQSARLAFEAGLDVFGIEFFDRLDLSIDGADEIDPDLCLIKGGGAAHTREKIVHAMSERFIVVADSGKLVTRLGEGFAVPVEVLSVSVRFVERQLSALGAKEILVRAAAKKDGPVVTDNGNLVLDARFDISSPEQLEQEIALIPGVLENGIFARKLVRPTGAIIAGAGGLRELGG